MLWYFNCFSVQQQVVKFAEMTQEVQITRPVPVKVEMGLTPGRRKANQLFRIAVNNLDERGHHEARKLDVDLGLVYSLGPSFSNFRLDSPEADQVIFQLMHHLEQRIQKRKILLDDFDARRKCCISIMLYPISKPFYLTQRQIFVLACTRWNARIVASKQRTPH